MESKKITAEAKRLLLGVYNRGTICSEDFDTIAKMLGLRVGVNIIVKSGDNEPSASILPSISSKPHPLSNASKIAIITALHLGVISSADLNEIARKSGVNIGILVEVNNQECADKLQNLLNDEY